MAEKLGRGQRIVERGEHDLLEGSEPNLLARAQGHDEYDELNEEERSETRIQASIQPLAAGMQNGYHAGKT